MPHRLLFALLALGRCSSIAKVARVRTPRRPEPLVLGSDGCHPGLGKGRGRCSPLARPPLLEGSSHQPFPVGSLDEIKADRTGQPSLVGSHVLGTSYPGSELWPLEPGNDGTIATEAAPAEGRLPSFGLDGVLVATDDVIDPRQGGPIIGRAFDVGEDER